MDELQDAFEDAQYRLALRDKVPYPTSKFKKLSKDQFKVYLDEFSKNLEVRGQSELEYICSGSLGFYLFTKFIFETEDKVLGEFLTDVALFRSKVSPSVVVSARNIYHEYLNDYSTGNKRYQSGYNNNHHHHNAKNNKNDVEENKNDSNYSSSFQQYSNSGTVIDRSKFGGHEVSTTGNQLLDLNQRPPTLNRNLLLNRSMMTCYQGIKIETSQYISSLNRSIHHSHDSQHLKDDVGTYNNNTTCSELTDDIHPMVSHIMNSQTSIHSPTVTFSEKNNQQNSNAMDIKNTNLSHKTSDIHINNNHSEKQIQRQDQSVKAGSHVPDENHSNITSPSSKNVIMSQSPPPRIIISQKVPIMNLDYWKKYLNKTISKNILGIHGIPLNYIHNNIHDSSSIPLSIYDEIDEIIFQYLTLKYSVDFKLSLYYKQYHEYMSIITIPIHEDDFKLIRPLGRGGFGVVYACRHTTTGKLYAVKKMNKGRIKIKKVEKLTISEKEILGHINSNYVVCLKYTYQSIKHVYLVLDLMTGGDLSYQLKKQGKFTMNETIYYISRILMGLQSLHEQNIVYRDLKPENILMDQYGRTKISDLGLACYVGPEGLVGACGTRGYWAPEMIRRDKYGHRERYGLSVDYFSLGTLIYEFLTGQPAFTVDLYIYYQEQLQDVLDHQNICNNHIIVNNNNNPHNKNHNKKSKNSETANKSKSDSYIRQPSPTKQQLQAQGNGTTTSHKKQLKLGHSNNNNNNNNSNTNHMNSPETHSSHMNILENPARLLTREERNTAIDTAILDYEPKYILDGLDPISIDLIQQLLIKKPHYRLGNTGIENIIGHPFFLPVDFNSLDYDYPPWEPHKNEINTVSHLNIGKFSDDDICEKMKLNEDDQDIYNTWNYISELNYEAEITEFLMYEDVYVSELSDVAFVNLLHNLLS